MVTLPRQRRLRRARHTAYLGLGANLGDPRATLGQALTLLQDEALHVSACSSLYRSAPVGPVQDQPPFLNAVARLRTRLSPHRLLGRCLQVEQALGRRRRGVPAKGPRTVDLDLLLWGAQVDRSRRLVLPHPELTRRAFVLLPLLELDPGLCDPRDGRVLERHLGDLLSEQAVEKVAGPGWWQERPGLIY